MKTKAIRPKTTPKQQQNYKHKPTTTNIKYELKRTP